MELIVALIDKMKPKFWDYLDSGTQASRHLFNFRRLWFQAILWVCPVAMLPLIILALVDYKVTQQSIESEILLRTTRLVSNTRRTISFFLIERKAAIDFILRDNAFAALNSPDRLFVILEDLKTSFGGFVDLGVIDAAGRQQTYVGPYNLVGKDYSGQEWFQEVRDRGVYISDVFKGYRNEPHMVIAVKSSLGQGDFFVLRATLDIERFNHLLSELELTGEGDAFIINYEGVLQTPSRFSGGVLDKFQLPVPEYNEKSTVREGVGANGDPLIFGYAYIEETPFILMIIKKKDDLMAPWYVTRRELIGFLGISLTLIVIVILSVATYLVNRIFMADQRRVMALHHVEYANKMASVGRLAAGVAHEINNPLAIINEKAGLIKDLLLPNTDLPVQPKLIGLINSVISSVDRCAAITHRLLNFARHVDVTVQPVRLEALIREVLGFLGKEAEYRSIEINISASEKVPEIISDRGKLQQIFLNLFNNAFAAMSDGGRLDIGISSLENRVLIEVADNGCGISASDLKRIFEPFFSTKTRQGGTGLGLSITYGLVHELGGGISVTSREGVGTKFIIALPIKLEEKGNATHTSTLGG
ncbi:MAG: ATP-binding protein [Desulfobacterales bacterium]|jgi:signal transduction histidine kinase|nr:ATP-binding protein [Desulfobacterales bacterium]